MAYYDVSPFAVEIDRDGIKYFDNPVVFISCRQLDVRAFTYVLGTDYVTRVIEVIIVV